MKTLTQYYEDLVLNPKANCFCMLKPGFLKYKDEFEKLLRVNGWKICKTCTKLFTRPEIEEFYICHKDKGFYNKLCDYMITEACQCYAVYKRIKNPVKDMESFKEKIRQEWGEDEMRNGMHSSDSVDNVNREIELAFNCVNERLIISKTTQQITYKEFLELCSAKQQFGRLKLNIQNIFKANSIYEMPDCELEPKTKIIQMEILPGPNKIDLDIAAIDDNATHPLTVYITPDNENDTVDFMSQADIKKILDYLKTIN